MYSYQVQEVDLNADSILSLLMIKKTFLSHLTPKIINPLRHEILDRPRKNS